MVYLSVFFILASLYFLARRWRALYRGIEIKKKHAKKVNLAIHHNKTNGKKSIIPNQYQKECFIPRLARYSALAFPLYGYGTKTVDMALLYQKEFAYGK